MQVVAIIRMPLIPICVYLMQLIRDQAKVQPIRFL